MMERLLKSTAFRTLALPVVFLLLAGNASAGEWKEIFYSSDGSVLSAQSSNFQKAGLMSSSQPEGWFKLIPPKNPDFSYMLALYRVDCDQRTLAALSASLHKKDGTVIEADGNDDNAPQVPVEPGTSAEAVYHHLCGHY